MKTIIAVAIVILVACTPPPKGKDKERNTSLKESAYSLVDYQLCQLSLCGRQMGRGLARTIVLPRSKTSILYRYYLLS